MNNESLGWMPAVVEKSQRFLKEQLLAGHYAMSCRGSDETIRFSDQKGHVFVAYFLVGALQGNLSEIERTILLVRILSEENDGVWGFSPPHQYVGPEHRHFVVDADDTAYVLQTLRMLGISRRLDPILRFHRPGPNGFVTFSAKEECRLALEPCFDNNLEMHPEVIGNVYRLILDCNMDEYIDEEWIERCQAADGHWHSYFYPSHYFSTSIFLEVLQRRPHLVGAVKRGLDFVKASQNSDGSWGSPGNPFETGLALVSLLAHGAAGMSLSPAVKYLQETWQPDGSWRSSEVIWRYHDREEDVWEARDAHGVLTTALVVSVFKRLFKSLAGGTP